MKMTRRRYRVFPCCFCSTPAYVDRVNMSVAGSHSRTPVPRETWSRQPTAPRRRNPRHRLKHSPAMSRLAILYEHFVTATLAVPGER